MLLPRPNIGESFSTYLFRFMSNNDVILEFPDTDQMTAVAETLYNTTTFEDGSED